MHLLFLNRSFWPDSEATGQHLTELCEDLSASHQITFIAGPSYHVASSRGHLWTKDRLGKILIIRTWGTRFAKHRLIGRLFNLGSYFVLAALAAIRTAKPDVLIAATDPPLLGMMAAALQKWWRCAFVYNVRDLYPDIAEANGGVKSRFLLGLLKWANRVAFAHADLVIVLGEKMRGQVLSKGVAPDKVVVVPDGVDCRKIVPTSSTRFRARWSDKFIVMYSGNLGLSQQLETVLDAAQRLRDDQRILFLFLGDGVRKLWLEEQARVLKLRNVQFLPYQPKEQLAESLSAADLHLIPLLSAATGAIVPSKTYGILAAGRPFVAMMESAADVAILARQFKVGVVVKPGDGPGLAQTIREAANNPGELKLMGERARRLAEEKFERKIIARRFAEALARMSTAGPNRRRGDLLAGVRP